MAASRKDDWQARATAKGLGALPELLTDLRDTSVPRLEARFLTLAQFAKHEAIARAAVEFFQNCPVRFREQLGTSVAAVGVASLHGARSAQLRDVKPPKGAANAQVSAWHDAVTRALCAALAHREKPPKPGTSRGHGALPTAPRAALQRAWLERAGHRCPDDLPVLLARLGDGPATDLTERAIALLSFPRDERIGAAAAALLERPPVKVGAEAALFTVLALVLCVHGDQRHVALSRALAQSIPSLLWLEAALPQTVVVASVAKKTKATVTSEADFLAGIAEAPGDDARVALFTDWLLEQGAPRGDFMALQRLGAPLTPAQEKKVSALQRKHEKQWLGSLARGGAGRAVFRMGVLREVSLSCWRGADVPTLDEPQLATVERLELEGGTNLPLGALLAAPGWLSLTSLTVAPWLLASVPLEVLGRLVSLGVFSSRPGTTEHLLKLPVLPALRRVQLRDQWFTETHVLAAPVMTHVEEVEIDTSQPAAWFPHVSRFESVELRPPYPRTKDSSGFVFRFRRGEAVRVTSAERPGELSVLKQALEALGRREVVLELPRALVSALQK